MQGISTQVLIVAGVVSALAGALPYLLSALLAPNRPKPKLASNAHLFRPALMAASMGLVIQAIYGVPVYLGLAYFELLNLPLVLLAYIVPVIILRWNSKGTREQLMLTTQLLMYTSTLALVSWICIAT